MIEKPSFPVHNHEMSITSPPPPLGNVRMTGAEGTSVSGVLAVILQVRRPPRYQDNDEFATVDALAFFRLMENEDVAAAARWDKPVN